MRQLEFDSLETRCCPSCTAVQSAAGAVTVRGDNLANTVEITDHGDGSVDITCGTTVASFSGVTKLTVSTRGGNDVVNYKSDADVTEPLVLRIDLGAGNDTCDVNLSDGNAVQADATITVLAGAGNDDVDFSVGAITDATVDYFADLGGGDDVAGVFLDGDLTNSDVIVAVVGRSGNDRIDMVSQDSSQDPLPIAMDATSQVDVILQGDSGNDDIYLDLTFTDDSDGSAILDVSGGFGNDTLALLAFNEAGDALPNAVVVDAVLDGGFGLDACDVVGNTPAVHC